MSKVLHTPWWLSGGAGFVFGAWFEISSLRDRHYTVHDIFTTSLIWNVVAISAFAAVGFIVIHEIIDRRHNARRARAIARATNAVELLEFPAKPRKASTWMPLGKIRLLLSETLWQLSCRVGRFADRRRGPRRMLGVLSNIPIDARTVLTRDEQLRAAVDRVRDALELIQSLDPRRLVRLRRDIDQISIVDDLRPQVVGLYGLGSRTCYLAAQHVQAELPARIALTIVHEATHARLDRLHLPKWGTVTARSEWRAFVEELSFAERLPRGLFRELDVYIAKRRRYIAGLSNRTATTPLGGIGIAPRR